MEPPEAVEARAAGAPAASRGFLVARALVFAVGLAVLGLATLGLLGGGFPPRASGVGLFAAGALLALALLAGAAAPQAVARALRTPGIASGGGLAAFALVAAALYFVFGLGTAVETARLLEQVAAGEDPADIINITRGQLVLSLLVNFVVFTVPVLAWAGAAECGEGPLAWLRLRGGNPKWSAIWSGVGVLLVFWSLIAAAMVAKLLGHGEVSNPRAEEIARSLDVPLALFVAGITGIGEEIFFRGFLLRKVGNGPQAVLFGLAHLNYLNVLEVVVTAGLGFMFGRAVQKTGSLAGPILAHAAFNGTSLLLILLRANQEAGLA